MEIWKDIPEFSGLYEASSEGRIRSKEGKTTCSARFSKRVWKQRVMKQKYHVQKGGRTDAMVCLWKDGKPYYLKVSRIIASTFIENNLFSNLTVNHKDGNPLNNYADNLEWMTRAENIQYGFENGQYSSFMKSICVVSKNGDRIDARSYAELDRKLGRYKGYTSRCFSIGMYELIDRNGKAYRVAI